MKLSEVLVFAVFILALVSVGTLFFLFTQKGQIVPQVGTPSAREDTTLSCEQYAPTVYFSVKNPLNASTDYVAQSLYILEKKSDGTYRRVATVTTTGGTSETFANWNGAICGATYKVVAVPGASAGSYITGADVSSGNDAVVRDGYVEFTVKKSNVYVSLQVPRWGAPQAKLYNADNKQWYYHSVAGACQSPGTYVDTGSTFTSTTNCTVPTTLGIGEFLNVELILKTTDQSLQFNDYGYLILVDASSAEYREPSVVMSNTPLTNIKNSGMLTPSESAAYANYEYIYYVSPEAIRQDANLKLSNFPTKLSFYIEPLAGVNPSSDIIIALSARGAYESVSGGVVNVGAVRDNAARTQVYTLQTWTIDLA